MSNTTILRELRALTARVDALELKATGGIFDGPDEKEVNPEKDALWQKSVQDKTDNINLDDFPHVTPDAPDGASIDIGQYKDVIMLLPNTDWYIAIRDQGKHAIYKLASNGHVMQKAWGAGKAISNKAGVNNDKYVRVLQVSNEPNLKTRMQVT